MVERLCAAEVEIPLIDTRAFVRERWPNIMTICFSQYSINIYVRKGRYIWNKWKMVGEQLENNCSRTRPISPESRALIRRLLLIPSNRAWDVLAC